MILISSPENIQQSVMGGDMLISPDIHIPGSKSITNRALILAALAEGTTTLTNASICEDTTNMISALRACGVYIEEKNHTITIEGTGGNFQTPPIELNLGNTGTAVRFMTALAGLIPGKTIITGSPRMQSRPIHDLTTALEQLGVNIVDTNLCPPLTIHGPTLLGGHTEIPGDKSSQYVSALLMACPYAQQTTVIKVSAPIVSKPYIDITLDMIQKFGGNIQTEEHADGSITFTIPDHQKYKAQQLSIEADASSAIYFCGIAAISGQKISINNVSPGTLQADMGCLYLFKNMGCAITNETTGFSIEGPTHLKALGDIDMNNMPDAVMTIAITAAFAEGKTTILNIGNLRIKECDRLEALQNELEKIGIEVSTTEDSITITGNTDRTHLNNTTIQTYGDHRIAMAFALASLKIPFLRIADEQVVAKSYPSFFEDLEKIGFHIRKNFTTNIILTGMRGTGKTSIGKGLAHALGMKWKDTDEEIEKQIGTSIKKFVQENGWEQFREIEKEIIRKISRLKNHIISTGGGALIDEENERLLHQNGIIILLKADIDTMKKRIGKNKKRPSLSTKKHTDEIEDIWQERKERYHGLADIVYDSSMETPDKEQDTLQKVTEVLQLLQEKLFQS